jgi:hypothetical protein
MLGTAYATNLSGFLPFGIEGWRVAFRSVAVVAMALGWLSLRYVTDPNYMPHADGRPKERAVKGIKDTMADFYVV